MTEKTELERLTTFLHSIERHPDYDYTTVTTGRKSCEDSDPYREKGEAEWTWNEHHFGGFERFDYTEEHYWRRLKSLAPEKEK